MIKHISEDLLALIAVSSNKSCFNSLLCNVFVQTLTNVWVTFCTKLVFFKLSCIYLFQISWSSRQASKHHLYPTIRKSIEWNCNRPGSDQYKGKWAFELLFKYQRVLQVPQWHIIESRETVKRLQISLA